MMEIRCYFLKETINIVVNESVAIQYFFIKAYANGGIPTMILGNYPGVGKSLVTKFTL